MALMNEMYDECKKVVKQWEQQFEKSFGRKPSKLDIKEADKNVRIAYCNYFKLKTAALEKSLTEVFHSKDENEKISSSQEILMEFEEYENEINPNKNSWGEILNVSNDNAQNVQLNSSNTNKKPSFTGKLFANTKFLKRNPRKSFTFSKHSSFSNFSDTSSSNTSLINVNSNSEKNVPEETISLNKSLPLKCLKFERSKSINVISHIMKEDTSNSSFRQIDADWLQRATKISVTDTTSNIYSNESTKKMTDLHLEDVISGSDEETSIPVAKRMKFNKSSDLLSANDNSQINQNNSVNVFELSETNNTLKTTNKDIEQIIDVNKYENISLLNKNNINEDEKLNSNKRKRNTNCIANETLQYDENTKKLEIINNLEDKTNEINCELILENNQNVELPKKGRKRISKKDPIKSHKKELSVSKNRRKNNKLKKKKEPNKELDEVQNTDSDNNYEMEYSVKPPPPTVPRYKKSKIIKIKEKTNETNSVSKNETNSFSKNEVAKKKLLQKIKSGSLNDNFVRIDIKKKVFVKGKKHLNFTKFKKQMWKNKKNALYGPDMDMRGCDGGELTCFKCGKTGHFAKQCKEKVAHELLPLDAVKDDECTLPSLEEISKIAKDSNLAVRVPNLIFPNQNDLEMEKVNNSFSDDEELENFMLYTEIVQQQIETPQVEDISVKPLYQLNDDGSLPETPPEVFEALNQFGHTSFRSGQEQAVMRILCGMSTLVTLSTGSGKSLCYQLPAYIYAKQRKCISLVISPLVSLMEDQVSGIPSFLKACCLHTLQTPTQKEKVLKLIQEGDLNVLLVSPEAVTSGEKKSGFGSLLRKLPPIAFACIDEAHCVSQWSHNFRPSYLVICRVLRERLGIKTVLGLTATSTYATSSSIVHHLQILDGHKGVISDIPLPDNLYLSVSSDVQKDFALINLLLSDTYDSFDSIIIYCTRRDECERIASFLRASIKNKNIDSSVRKYKSLSSVAESYHAGLTASKRRSVQNAFMNGYLRIVVATVAFGMGINKSNIRSVIHYNMPKNFESYVQEVGRAGRDGLSAHCHLFLDSEGKDQNELRRHIYSNSMDRHVIRKLLQKIFIPCDCKNKCPRHEVAFSIEETVKLLDVPEENISTLLCYLELHEKGYLEVLPPVYTKCKIIAYGDPKNIIKAAKDCPPLAMALILQKIDAATIWKENIFEFPVVDVAAAMGWDSGIVKGKLKNLEWIQENNLPRRSTLTVEFSNLGFHVRSPGNLSPTELDEALDTLYEKKMDQEITSLKQLQVVFSTLTEVSEKYYHLCLSENYQIKALQLKSKIREYFSSEQPLKNVKIENKTTCNEAQIAADARTLMAMYRDNSFTGRSIARIFHGIQSPNYPAVIWGRCKFWRAYLDTDFNKICQICNSEILQIR